MQLTLTEAEIREDIQMYQDRIEQAQSRLAGLPAGRLPYPEHKKREKQKRDFKGEIEHVERLIKIAVSAL